MSGHRRFAIVETSYSVILAQEPDIEIVGGKPRAKQRIGREERQHRRGFPSQHVAHHDARLAGAGDDGKIVDLERAGREVGLENPRRIDEHVHCRGHRRLAEEARQWQGGELGPKREVGGDLQAGETHRTRPVEAARNRVSDQPVPHRILLVELGGRVESRKVRTSRLDLGEAVRGQRAGWREDRAAQSRAETRRVAYMAEIVDGAREVVLANEPDTGGRRSRCRRRTQVESLRREAVLVRGELELLFRIEQLHPHAVERGQGDEPVGVRFGGTDLDARRGEVGRFDEDRSAAVDDFCDRMIGAAIDPHFQNELFAAACLRRHAGQT